MRLSLHAFICILFCLGIVDTTAQNNSRPEITGQTPSPLVTSVNQSITISLSNLIVDDPDPQPVYPNGFTLEISTGRNYSVDDYTVIPDRNFAGTLRVPVRVDDGRQRSRRFDVEIEVRAQVNEVPEITGQVDLVIQAGQSFEITLSHLIVIDTDNRYPDDFDLDVYNGTDYNRNGNTITPRSNFTGTLTVPVSVDDGTDESDRYNLRITVAEAVNTVPVITGQGILSTDEETPLVIRLSDLRVTDPDNAYPGDFTLKVHAGSNYALSGNTITPAKDFTGSLTVQVQVNDGDNDSDLFGLTVTVNPINDPPIITGQSTIVTTENTPVTITFDHLRVTDPDSNYPIGFSMKIASGNNYTVAGNSIRPRVNFNGELTVRISVTDGSAESNEFPLKILVEPAAGNIAPVITGQVEITPIVENSSRLILLSYVKVTDPDNIWPTDFILKVLPGENYAVEGSTISPSPNFRNNTLTVNVLVNDGKDDSAPYGLRIDVVPSTNRPQINGQKEISMKEDASLEITLSMLEVVDADNPGFPKGFSLHVQSGNEEVYTLINNSITPAKDLNGFVDIGVKVSDGVNMSDEFTLSVFVEPVNDAPELLNLDPGPLSYEPGDEPLELFENITLKDVDNDHLTFAEIGFDSANHSPLNDELIINDSTNLKVIYDPNGILFLVGYGTLDEYQRAISSIRYHYRMTVDENGNPTGVLSGPRNIYITLHDGQDGSERYNKQISIETKVALDIPNTFTPNGDRSNDTWKIRSSAIGQLDKAIIRVYDKRGLLLYETIGFENEWDGAANGQRVPVDTYYYTIDLNLSYMKQTYKGFVTILY